MTEDSTRHPNEIVTKLSPRSVPDTVARLTGMLSGKGLRSSLRRLASPS